MLYPNTSQRLVSEKDWIRLVRAIAAGDQLALHALYERAHRTVFTLVMRITSNRDTAEDLTLEVFHDVWRRASGYDAANGTVLGWIMNQARSRAIDRLRVQQRKKNGDASPDSALLTIDAPDHLDVLEVKDQRLALRNAVEALTADERQIIEAAFFSELTYDEVGARLNRSPEATRTRMRSALHKLRDAIGRGRGKNAAAAQTNPCDRAELVCAYALRALAPGEVGAIAAHFSTCWQCRRELETLRPVVDAFVAWPTDVLRPSGSPQARLARRIAAETAKGPVLPPARQWSEPEWESVAPGISCKLLATDTERHMVSMLVRLAPGGEYPPHTHAGTEELHLLDGELWIDDRKLHPGDYYRAEPGTGDKRVWSITGCTCVLTTSTKDILR